MRMPLPQFSAWLPSAFQTVMRGPSASKLTSSTPSAPTPNCALQSSMARSGLIGASSSACSTTMW